MKYDIAIIGAGSGGYSAAIHAARNGKKVALIERGILGGTCLNWGCIPTKTLHRNAEVIHLIRNIEEYGVKIDGYDIDLDIIQKRKQNVIDQLRFDLEASIARYKITLVKGYASFIDAHTLEINKQSGEKETLEADYIIIASGSIPLIPPLEGSRLDGVISSTELLAVKEIPETLAIIGAGVVGVEFASIYETFGTKITLISATDRILNRLDQDMTDLLERSYKKLGIEIIPSARAQRIEQEASGLYTVVSTTPDGEVRTTAEKVLMAIGRKPYVGEMMLENAGVSLDRDAVWVDSNYRTSQPNIFAIGDVNRKMMLAYTAAAQGVGVVDLIMGRIQAIEDKTFASCIFVFPELAFVGISEEEAIEQRISYKVNKYYFKASAKALALNEHDGLIKVLSDSKETIIGVHILGPHATDIIHEATLAMSKHMKVDDIVNMIHAHPTLPEALHEAIMGLKNESVKLYKKEDIKN